MTPSFGETIKYALILVAYLLSVFGVTITPSPLYGSVAFRSGLGAERPNIILCMADDQGFGDVAYNGDPVLKTPNLDDMASAGLRFDRFYAAAPVCSPTRASVLTGRHPNRFGCFKYGHTLRPQEITIAEVLRTAGYVTGHFGKWHLGSVLRGSTVNPGSSGFDHWVSAPNYYDYDPILSREGKAVQFYGESSIVTVDLALDFIRDQVRSEKKFFAVIWFSSPHLPHMASTEDRMPYRDQGANADFYGEIHALDRAIGKLRRELRALSIHENTLQWYCSDNGGLQDYSSGGRGKKGAIYEGGLRVPAVLEWPDRINAESTTRIPVTTSDIYPTILEIVGINPPKQPVLDGVSILPLINGTLGRRPRPIGFWSYPTRGKPVRSDEIMSKLLQSQKQGTEPTENSIWEPNTGKHKRKVRKNRYPDHAAWLDWPWKLHRIQRKKADEVILELYNLENDPMEQNSLVDEHVELVEVMQSQLETWQRSVIRSLNFKDY